MLSNEVTILPDNGKYLINSGNNEAMISTMQKKIVVNDNPKLHSEQSE